MSGFFGEITIDSENDVVSVNGHFGTIAHRDYFVWSPQSSESLLDQITALMASLAGFSVSYSIDATSGVVTLSAPSLFDVSTWQTDTMCGFAVGEMSGASSYVGQKAMMYCWLPDLDPSDSLAPYSRPGALRSHGAQTQTESGKVHTSTWGLFTDQELHFQFLSNNKTWAQKGDNSSFEEFWTSTLRCGRRFLFVPGYPSDLTTRWAYKAVVKEESMFQPKRQIPGSDTYWKFNFKLHGA